MKRILFSCAIVLLFSACVPVAMPPIVITPAPPSAPAPVVTPAAKPRATIAFQVVDESTVQPIGVAFAKFEDGTTKQAGDDGYLAFERELGFYAVTFSADDYATVTRNFQLESNRQFTVKLKSTKPLPLPVPPTVPATPPTPTPPVVVALPAPTVPPPAAAGILPQCGAGENTGRISQECIDAVAAVSSFSKICTITGDTETCNHFVRDVARALKAAQHDERWGLIKKTGGGDNVDGYGTDIVAYLPSPLSLTVPTWRWNGADIVGGIGKPGARLVGGQLNAVLNCDDWKEGMGWCNRSSDVWAPVP
jgi:hypothetical protein